MLHDRYASDSVLNDLTTALDVIVLEALSTGGFQRVEYSHVPRWFHAAFHDAAGGRPVSLQQAFPVLDAFLKDADKLWAGGVDGRADSEAFVIADADGRDVPLVATALAIRGRKYLLIQHDGSYHERQKILQSARDHALEHERTLKQVNALRKPIAALLRAVDDQSTSESPSGTAVRQHASALRSLLDELPQTPRPATARHR
jgi:hypothetical protein